MAGRLTQAEFAERVETAYAARVGDELALTQKPLPNVAIAPAVGPRRKPTRLTPAVFRHVIKRGSWRLRRWSLAASVFSDLDLDVRGAERDTTHSVITVLVAFGNADVYVPDDIDVTVGGSASSADGVIGATTWLAPPPQRSGYGCYRCSERSTWRVPSDMKRDTAKSSTSFEIVNVNSRRDCRDPEAPSPTHLPPVTWGTAALAPTSKSSERNDLSGLPGANLALP